MLNLVTLARHENVDYVYKFYLLAALKGTVLRTDVNPRFVSYTVRVYEDFKVSYTLLENPFEFSLNVFTEFHEFKYLSLQ